MLQFFTPKKSKKFKSFHTLASNKRDPSRRVNIFEVERRKQKDRASVAKTKKRNENETVVPLKS